MYEVFNEFEVKAGEDRVINLIRSFLRNHRGHIFPCQNLRIRPEQHNLEPGEIFCPRHHGQHYHIEAFQPGGKWKNAQDVKKILPPNYKHGDGTGFVPGENFPGR